MLGNVGYMVAEVAGDMAPLEVNETGERADAYEWVLSVGVRAGGLSAVNCDAATVAGDVVATVL